jgi:hypothetical protein
MSWFADPLPVEEMYYRASATSPWRAKRGTSDVENTNLHINGVLTAPGHSPELAHSLFTDALGRRNIRMAINNGDFSVAGVYELRPLWQLLSSCNELGSAAIRPPNVDAKSVQYLQFLKADRTPERFGFYASMPATSARRSRSTVQAVQHEANLPAGKHSS